MTAAYRLEAQVPESMIGTIRKGDTVRIELEAASKEEVQGRVSEIVPSADPSTRSTIVKVDLPSRRFPSIRTLSVAHSLLPANDPSSPFRVRLWCSTDNSHRFTCSMTKSCASG